MHYCRRRELGDQHAFYLAPAIKIKIHCTPQLFVARNVIPFVVFKTPISSRNRKTMVFELSSVARLTPEGPGGEAPVYELGKAMDWGPGTLFPQRSRNSSATQLGGGAPMAPHGAIYHETYSAIEWHMAAIH